MNLDERADALDERLKDNPIDAAISTLTRDAKRRRRQIIALTISLVLDVFLTIGFAALSIQARDTAEAASKSQASIIASCQAGNEFRLTEGALWNHLLSLPPVGPSNLTPEQQAQQDKLVADFKTYLKTTFAPRDCSNIIKK